MPSSVVLPLSLNSDRNFQAFFKAIEDPSIQDAILADQGVDPGVREIVCLARDEDFLKQAEALIGLMRTHRSVSTEWQGSFAAQEQKMATASSEQVVNDAEKIRNYVQTKYPEGVRLLSEYGKLAQPAHLITAGTVQAWTNVAAYAEALVNAAVYANVAVATHMVVAAAAAAVIAAAVMVP